MKKTKKFTDEKDFTINAVIPWLKTSKDYAYIEYTGGKDEYGRDIVFSKKELGNREVYYAIQVKDDDLKGDHSNKGVQEVIRQLTSAMNQPFIKKDGKQVNIQGLWVVVYGKITNNARNAIMNSTELKGRSISFYDYSDILKNLRESPLNISLIKYLIRLKGNSKTSCENLKKELNKTKLKYKWAIYENKPKDDMFESETDNYVDLSFDSFFEDVHNHPIWKKIENSIKNSKFNLDLINLRMYYPKVFSFKEIDSARKRFLKDAPIKTHEDMGGPYFSYACNKFNFHKEDWIKNVNNLQILQEN
ncbi:MAG: restriction endonuclease [Nanoarchaeota archaeon]